MTAVRAANPIRLPTRTDASLMAAALAGRPRGTLAKMMAVLTEVATTKPAPISTRGTAIATYTTSRPMTTAGDDVAQADGREARRDECPRPDA